LAGSLQVYLWRFENHPASRHSIGVPRPLRSIPFLIRKQHPFTIFIATTFLPCKIALSEFGKKIAENTTGSVPQDPAALKLWIDNNESLDKFLQLKFDFIETLKYAIPVLSPVLSTLLPGFFGHGKG